MNRLELTVTAAQDRARRDFLQDPYSPQNAADWYRGVIDSSEAEGMLALGREYGSLAGLVLAAEDVDHREGQIHLAQFARNCTRDEAIRHIETSTVLP